MGGMWYERMKLATDRGVRLEWGGRKGAAVLGHGPFAKPGERKSGPEDYRAAASPLLRQGMTKRAAAKRLATDFDVGFEAVRKALKGFSP